MIGPHPSPPLFPDPSPFRAALGNYTITGITPGTYDVREVPQAGWTCSFPVGCKYTDTFISGVPVTGNDFGNWTPATKSRMNTQENYTNDQNSDADPCLPGWT